MNEISRYFSIGETISRLLYPHGEVVIHDLKTGKIVAIFNNLSKRKVGDESLIEELADYSKLPDIFPVYEKTNWDGKKMKSSTATIRDKKGTPIALFCINLDISHWKEFRRLIDQLCSHENQPEVLFKEDWREKINLYVTEYLKKEGAVLKTLSKEKKKELVKALFNEGAFSVKHAASYVADVLDLSRATIYNYRRQNENS